MSAAHRPAVASPYGWYATAAGRTVGSCDGPGSLVAEAVEETAEDATFAGKGRAGCGCDRALAGDGLVVVGAGDGVDDLGFAEVFGALDLGHVADEHAVAHDLGLQAGCAVGVPLSFAAAGQ